MTPGPSRRDLFRGLFGRANKQPMGEVSPPPNPPRRPPQPEPPRFGRGVTLPVLRPPGAVEESAFLAACTRCDACLTACPHDAVTHAPARLRGATGTPVLDPPAAPCRMCDDRPCIAACPTGALRFDVPAKMGTATISPVDCLARTGCSACADRCPVPAAIRWENGRPVIDPAVCTGCGVCRFVCPAPRNAVLIVPTRGRPFPPPAETPP